MKEIKKIIQSSNPKNPYSDNMQGWEIKKLLDVVDFQRGLTYSKNDEVDFSDNIVLRSNNVDLKTNKLDFTELKYINPKIVIPENKKVTKGSLIICTANGSKSHLGKVALIDDDYDYAFGGFMGLIKPKENLNSDFLFYLMTSETYKKFIGALSDGANINNLKFGDLGEFEIPLPPLPEQQRIVSILDECFSAIERSRNNAEQNLKNAKEVFESYLQGVFGGSTGSPTKRDGWEEKKLGEIALIKGGKRVPKGYKLEYENTNHPYIRVTDFNDYGSIDLNDIRYVNDNVFNEIKNYTISKNDLYLSIAGTIGKTGIVPDELDGANLTENACKLVFKENIDKKFVYYFTKTESFKIQTGLNTRTAAMPKLALTRLASIKFHVPKLIQTQNDFVQKFDAISAETQKLEAVYQKKLDDLEELKKSVLRKAFAGEL